MENIIALNAYGILGLLPDAAQKDIHKRSRELEKLLSIGETPRFEGDFGFYEKRRSLSAIKTANNELLNPQKQLLHAFFRAYAPSKDQLEAFDSSAATIARVNMAIKNGVSTDFINAKNLAIALSLSLMSESVEQKYAEFCVDLWFEILSKQKVLDYFKKIFLHYDAIGINEAHFENLKENLTKALFKVFEDIAARQNNGQILARFIKKFDAQNLDLDIGREHFEAINKTIATLDNLISAAYDEKRKAIGGCLATFRAAFMRLRDLGIYDSNKALQIRDLVAEKLRELSINLNNKFSKVDEALELAEFSVGIAGTEGLRARLGEDVALLKKNMIKGKNVAANAKSKMAGNSGGFWESDFGGLCAGVLGFIFVAAIGVWIVVTVVGNVIESVKESFEFAKEHPFRTAGSVLWVLFVLLVAICNDRR